MDAEEVWQGVVTGDIVFAKPSAAGQEPVSWTKLGMVIRPEDIGVLDMSPPVVFTVEGTLGEMLPAVRALGYDQLGIVQPEAMGSPDWLAHLRAAVTSVPAVAIDTAGAIVLGKLGGNQPTRTRAVDQSLAFQRLLEATGRASVDPSNMRCALDGNRRPCPVHD
jgi:hypothetical protein